MNKYSIIILIIIISLIPSTSGQSGSKALTLQSEIVFTGYVIPTAIIADYRFFEDYGVQTESYAIELVELANSYYFNNQIPVKFDIQFVEIFTSESLANSTFTYTVVGSEIDPNTLLFSVDNYKNTDLAYADIEEVIYLSGHDFTGGTVGLGYIGDPTVSRTNGFHGVNINQADHFKEFDSSVIAHEVGHNLGAYHLTSTACDGQSGIMQSFLSFVDVQTTFTTCSQSSITALLETFFVEYSDSLTPDLNSPEDIILPADDGTFELIWNVGDQYPGTYWISGDYQIGNTNWINGSISIAIPKQYVTHLVITISVTDMVGHIVNDTVEVFIEENNQPTISSPDDLMSHEGEESLIIWDILDNDSTHLKYEFYINDSLDLFNNVTITPDVVLHLSYTTIQLLVGVYNLTVRVIDYDSVIEDSVIVEIIPAVSSTPILIGSSIPSATTSTESSGGNTSEPLSDHSSAASNGPDLLSYPTTLISIFFSFFVVATIRTLTRKSRA